MTTKQFEIESLGECRIPNPSLSSHTLAVSDEDRILYSPTLKTVKRVETSGNTPESFEISGPREKIYFKPVHTKAAIVSCGGLCPGINAVIRALVRQLWYRYRVRNIVGVKYGYNGLGLASQDAFIPLEPKLVNHIDTRGGTILGTSRGIPKVEEIVDTLEQTNINQLYAIGGDGTMRGALGIHKEIQKRGLKIAIVGIPKTIKEWFRY